MRFERIVFFVFVCVLFASTHARLNSTQTNAVKDFFKKLLQVDDFAVEFGAKPTKERKKMHTHMLELYQHFKDRNIQNNAIIRSIEPLKRFPDILKNVLMFNISSLRPSEKILTSHLHVFRRRISDRITDDSMAWTPLPPCKIRLFQIHMSPDIEAHWKRLDGDVMATWSPVTAKKKRHLRGLKTLKESLLTVKDMLAEFRKEGNDGVKLKPLDVIPVPQLSKGGWYSVEISMALKEMLNSAVAPMNSLLGVRFEGPRGKSIIPQRFLKEPKDNTSSSFIVISSEDTPVLINFDDTSENKIDLNQDNAKLLADIISLQNLDNFKNKPNIVKSKKYGLEKSSDNKNTEQYTYTMENTSMNYKKADNTFKHTHNLTTNFKLIENEINGDITDELKISSYPKKNRHNHKNVNTLKIRYDSATNTIVQKKTDDIPDVDLDIKPRVQTKYAMLSNFIPHEIIEKPKNIVKSLTEYFVELSSDEDGTDRHNIRKKRSTEDNDLPTIPQVLASHSDELSQVRVPHIEANSKNDKKIEKPGEDDLGDTFYYEPDVYEHEKMVPIRYQTQYFDSGKITEITEKEWKPFKHHKHEIIPKVTVKPQHNKYMRHNKWDSGETKIREHSLTIKNANPQQTKYRHKKRPMLSESYQALVHTGNFNDDPITSQTKIAKKRSNVDLKSEIRQVNRENNSRNKNYKYSTTSAHAPTYIDKKDDEDEFVLDIETLGSKSETNSNQNDGNSLLRTSAHNWDKNEILNRIHKYSDVSDELGEKIENARQHIARIRNEESAQTASNNDKTKEPSDGVIDNGIKNKETDWIAPIDDQNEEPIYDVMGNGLEDSKIKNRIVESIDSVKTNSNKRQSHKNRDKIVNEEDPVSLQVSGGNIMQGEDEMDALQQFKVKNHKTTSSSERTTIQRKQSPRMIPPKRKLNISAHLPKPSLINDWKLWDNNDWDTGSVNRGDPCRKKHFQVSFAELGWGDWIIAPDNFSTNYCAGHCQLSHLVDLDSTNHAILQSLIHTINRVSGVPEPCCVPAKMSSKTVLYQDPHGNVMLRNYPNMVVNTCECR